MPQHHLNCLRIRESKVALAQRMHASGESATTIAATLGVSRATIYRIPADADSAD